MPGTPDLCPALPSISPGSHKSNMTRPQKVRLQSFGVGRNPELSENAKIQDQVRHDAVAVF